jgi:hypothetical protein
MTKVQPPSAFYCLTLFYSVPLFQGRGTSLSGTKKLQHQERVVVFDREPRKQGKARYRYWTRWFDVSTPCSEQMSRGNCVTVGVTCPCEKRSRPGIDTINDRLPQAG